MQRQIHITERPEMTAEDDYLHNTQKRDFYSEIKKHWLKL